MSNHRKCCCGPGCSFDCIDSDGIGSGCCTSCEPLLLWCQRPGYTNTQSYLYGSLGNPTCQTHYQLTTLAMDPVQAIYHYYGAFLKCRFPNPGEGLESLLPSVPRCLDPFCDPRQDCCGGPPYFGCECGHNWLSDYRRDTWLSMPDGRWGVELACFNNNAPLSATVGSLYATFLCVVHLEKWWRIPTETCAPTDRIYVPGCTQSPTGGNCGGVPFNTTQLVPEYFIHACSGVPLFSWEIDDALARNIIDGTEASQLLIDIGNKQNPDQATLWKLYNGGYLKTGDWREEQRQAFIDLDARFPGAGYGLCIEPCDQMDPLGPFRKRLVEPFANPSATPVLRRGDSIANMLTIQVPANCFKNYPGSLQSQLDYEYWGDRQWVYFRGVPGGWSWVCWGFTEQQILNGSGRNSPGCIEALKGNPRPNPNCLPLGAICPTRRLPYCNWCTQLGCPECGQSLAQGCGPFPAIPVATSCENLVVKPRCEGVHFIWAQYHQKNQLTHNATTGECLQSSRTECLYVAHSFLVEAKRVYDSWDASCPFRCRIEKPPLSVFKNWDAVENGHFGPRTICTEVVVPSTPPLQTVNDLCCSGKCWDYNYINGYPCLDETGQNVPCNAITACPPHSTNGQLACIGYTPNC